MELAEYDPLPPDEVIHRVGELQRLNAPTAATRTLVRHVMRGGRSAILALLGEDTKIKDQYLPAANFMWTAMHHMGRIIGQLPDLRIDLPLDADKPSDREKAQRLEWIAKSYEQRSDLAMKLPLVGRWLPGYGFALMMVKPRRDKISGQWYPHIELRNSADIYPGWWGPDQEPMEVAAVRKVEAASLAKNYPHTNFADRWTTYKQSMSMGRAKTNWFGNVPAWSPLRRGGGGSVTEVGAGEWEGVARDPVTVVEYMCESGCYLVAQETEQVLDYIPNVLHVPNFHLAKRIDFDSLTGQWDHMIGLQSMIAKLNVLGFIAAQDSVFRETNIIGDPLASPYRRGRHAINRFPAGVMIDRPTTDANLQQTFTQLNVLERQLRVAGNYPVAMDGQSPNSFVTGQGLERLGESTGQAVEEYQQVISHALEKIDTAALMLDEAMYSGQKKPLEVRVRGGKVSKMYDPKEIGERYKTRRVYGVMAGWDTPQQIVAGLQLVQGRIIDRRLMRENLSGLADQDLDQLEERIVFDAAFEQVLMMLSNRAAQGDPNAAAALGEIVVNPKEMREIIAKWITPQEPQVSPEEQAAMAQMGGGPQQEGPPPDIATVLSRLEMAGSAEGGVQTVGQL